MTLNDILSLGDPVAIAGLIVLVMLSSANFQAFWTLAHISQEIGEFPPAPTHNDSFGSVVFKVVLSGTVASPNHMSPDSVRATFPTLWRMTMNAFLVANGSPLVTPTALRSFFAQLLRVYSVPRPAITLAQPLSASSISPSDIGDHCPKAELLAHQIDPLGFKMKFRLTSIRATGRFASDMACSPFKFIPAISAMRLQGIPNLHTGISM